MRNPLASIGLLLPIILSGAFELGKMIFSWLTSNKNAETKQEKAERDGKATKKGGNGDAGQGG